MGGDQVSGGVLQPLVVSGLLSIGLIGAAGSPLDAIPLSSMYAQLPLATGYNASDALYCVQVRTHVRPDLSAHRNSGAECLQTASGYMCHHSSCIAMALQQE